MINLVEMLLSIHYIINIINIIKIIGCNLVVLFALFCLDLISFVWVFIETITL